MSSVSPPPSPAAIELPPSPPAKSSLPRTTRPAHLNRLPSFAAPSKTTTQMTSAFASASETDAAADATAASAAAAAARSAEGGERGQMANTDMTDATHAGRTADTTNSQATAETLTTASSQAVGTSLTTTETQETHATADTLVLTATQASSKSQATFDPSTITNATGPDTDAKTSLPPPATTTALPSYMATSHTTPPATKLCPLGVVDLLEADPRPSLVVDLSSPSIVYGNPALLSVDTKLFPGPAWTAETLPLPLSVPALAGPHAALWAGLPEKPQQEAPVALPAVAHLGRCWTRMVLRGGVFAVISANEATAVTTAAADDAVPASTPNTAVAVAATASADQPATNSSEIDRDQFAAITNLMPVGFGIVDAVTGTVLQANPAWFRKLGCPTTAAIDHVQTHEQFLSCVADEYRETVRGFHLQAAAQATSDDAKQQQHAKDTTPPFMTFGFRVKPPAPSTPDSPNTPVTPNMPDTSDTPDALDAPDAPAASAHILAIACPEMDTATGRVTRIHVCLRQVDDHKDIVATADRHARQASNLRRMAEFATVGIYDMDLDGRLRGANRVFLEMCGLEDAADDRATDMDVKPGSSPFTDLWDLSQQSLMPWRSCVVEQDQPLLDEILRRTREGVAAVSAAVTAGDDNGGLETAKGSNGNGKGNGNTSGIRSRRRAADFVQTAEVRLTKPFTTDDGAGHRIEAPRWIEATFLPVTDAAGRVQSVTGCLSDVSLRRWQLERERQVKDEAIESRRQQANFVDITSHEIRNPLTVIMHCADAVLESLQRVEATKEAGTLALKDAIDYAEIIVSSALHQKAIVDDILTMSKLDSERLAVTPVVCEPLEIVRSTLKMFGVQARQNNIALNMVVDPSFDAILGEGTGPNGVGPLLRLDPARVKQILINLLTNALKFTRAAVDGREVTTTVRVSRTRPTNAMCGVAFAPRGTRGGTARPQPVTGSSSTSTASTASTASLHSSSSSPPPPPAPPPADRESVFLLFEVKDTGEGLTKEGMETLFQKFVQADSRTHIKHGGSGLGLFISKRLAELQNGGIGVASQPGIGSRFVFYIEAGVPPPSAVPDMVSPGEQAKQMLAGGSVTGGLQDTVVSRSSSTASGAGKRPAAVAAAASSRAAAEPKTAAAVHTDMDTDDTETDTETETDMAETDESEDEAAATFMTAPSPDTASNGSSTMPAASTTHEDAADASTDAVETPRAQPPRDAYFTAAATTAARTDDSVRSEYSSSGSAPGSPAAGLSASSSSTTALARVPETTPALRGVLLVEDNVINQRVTRRYLEQCGFAVQVAAHGEEALDRLRASDRCVAGGYPISVVLMDMEMPVLDGLRCTRQIRALEAAGQLAGGRLPVLMITGNARPEQLAEARAAGCDDVVVKPFQMHKLFASIKSVMQALWEADVAAATAATAKAAEDAAEDATEDATEATETTETAAGTGRKGVPELDEGVVLREAA